MRIAVMYRIAWPRRRKSAFQVSATTVVTFCALMFLGAMTVAFSQDARPAAGTSQDARAAVASTPPTTPSPGKALVYIYRVGRFIGSASHDHLFINGIYLAYLLNGEYAWMEVAPGTAVVTGMPQMYYGGIIQSTGAALNDARKKENERIRLDVEAGKIYYLKWTSSTMATGIKVTLQDQSVGAKEMSKLHLSKPVVQPDDKTRDAWK